MEPHDQDLYEWAKQNAQLIREGRFDEIDAENIADELEAMSGSQRRELLSRLTVLITHLLEWWHQQANRGRSWLTTIVQQRIHIMTLLDESPSLKRFLPELAERAYGDARKVASIETGLPIDTFPSECPFSIEQILQEGFLPESV